MPLMRVSDNALRDLIEGTFVATLLLGAQEGGKPFNEAACGCGADHGRRRIRTHISGRHEGGVSAYFGSVYRGIVCDLPRIIGAQPTVRLLVLTNAAVGWFIVNVDLALE